MPMMGSRTFLLTALAACLIVSCHGLPKTPKTTEEVVPETQAELDSDNNEQDSDNDKLGQMLTQYVFTHLTRRRRNPIQSWSSPTRNIPGTYEQLKYQAAAAGEEWAMTTRRRRHQAWNSVIGSPTHQPSRARWGSAPTRTTEAPTTEAPTTEAPTTEAPTPPTEAPTTEAPTTKAPTPPTPPPTEAKPLTISSGSCSLDTAANCAFSPAMAAGGYYGNSQTCSITVGKSGRVSSTSFSTEEGFDKLTIAGQAFSGDGSQGPSNVHVTAGSTISWSSDGSIGSYGWGICLSEECGANCATCEGPGVHQCLTCASHMHLNGAAPAQCIPGPTGDDSCQWANDNACDEPTHCSAGTDATDCA